MADCCMTFSDDWREFLKEYSFKDEDEVYTNGSQLIQVFRVEQLIEHLIAQELLKGQEPQTVGGWISVEDKLPESGKHVLLTCEIRSYIDGFKKRYVCDGFYSKAHTLPQWQYPEDDVDYDYDEDEDEYYLKEGWYEVINNWDDYSSVVIYDFVTHWMPLPEPPKEDDA